MKERELTPHSVDAHYVVGSLRVPGVIARRMVAWDFGRRQHAGKGFRVGILVARHNISLETMALDAETKSVIAGAGGAG